MKKDEKKMNVSACIFMAHLIYVCVWLGCFWV